MSLAVEIKNLHKIYPKKTSLCNCLLGRTAGAGFQALGDVTFDIKEGEFFGLLGPNGAGKTTIISILAGLTKPSSGSVKIFNYDVQTDYKQARRCLGVVPQELVYDPFFSVVQTLRNQSGFFGLNKNEAWIEELLYKLNLTDKADANMRSLSGGMKRRVLVAQALVHKPPVIILDEPTAGVDIELRQNLWKFIKELNQKGHTILLTTHYLEEAQEMCDRIAFLRQGNLVACDETSKLLKGLGVSSLEDAFLKFSQYEGFFDVSSIQGV
ncbi:ABC transporter ATP-binding protein [Taylorella equigenitalis]|uniref:ABC transporter ATP-binding protein n=1 Tax=Taylorella equigenitalis TaxID=29575 RepID=UPI0003F9F635|nr:ABC transporter ATP-binding protein [Taylorella equigenitalis]WDU53255.1 ABC transporter ATP-binding protein [Taylorella equigenitalis]